MNQRLPRLALLVVLLVTMVGVFRIGTPAPADGVRAQDTPIACGPWKPYPEATPIPDSGFEVTRTYEITEESNSNLEFAKALTEITLFQGGELSVVSDESAILAIDTGLVKLTVCGAGTQVGIQLPGETRPTQFGPPEGQTEASIELPANSALFIDPDDPYFLTGLADGEATPSASVQQLDLELSSNALPAAQSGEGGSKIRVVTGISRKLCSGAGC